MLKLCNSYFVTITNCLQRGNCLRELIPGQRQASLEVAAGNLPTSGLEELVDDLCRFVEIVLTQK